MKGLVAAVLFVGFGVANSFADDFSVVSAEAGDETDVRKQSEMALGASAAYGLKNFRGSGDFLYNPVGSFGVVGLSVGGLSVNKDFQGDKLRVTGTDVLAKIGYWSNQERKSWLGWNIYYATGFSYFWGSNSAWEVAPRYSNVSEVGLGLNNVLSHDLYRDLAKNNFIIFDYTLVWTNRAASARSLGSSSKSEKLFGKFEDLSFKLTARYWFQ